MRKAIDALRHAAKLGPNHEEVHFNLALAYEQVDRLSEALQEISAAVFLEPNDPEAHNMQAVIYAELGDFKRAREKWIYLTQAVPGYVPAYRNLAALDEMRDDRLSSSCAANYFHKPPLTHEDHAAGDGRFGDDPVSCSMGKSAR